MDLKSDDSLKDSALRLCAERRAGELSGGARPEPDSMDPVETGALLRELQVHQIELEIQNENLRQIQGKLHASRARYFDLYDLAPVGYCTLSAEDVILEANAAVLRMLGSTRGALVRKPITRFIFSEDQDLYYLHRKKFLGSPGPHSCELRMLNADGGTFWVQLTATGAPAGELDSEPNDEEPSVTRLVLSDISELKRVEDDKTTLATQLHHARKLETLGVLAAGISTDFKTLLAAILSNANAGSQAADGNDAQSRYFGAIETSALRATDLIHQVLAYAGKAKWTLEEVDLGLVAGDLCRTLETCLPRNLTFRCDLADRLPYWKGDASQAFQILMNLAMNAFEAFPEGVPGEITLRTCVDEILPGAGDGNGIWVLPVVPGRYVVLEVADSGHGMAPDHLYHAFEPFFTTKATGRGLGLAAIHGILSGHEGGLWARSGPGQGTSMRVYLPAMREPRAGAKGKRLSAWRGHGLILVVDPEPGSRSMAKSLAERCGFTVMEAMGGIEAVERFRRHHSALALVLLDRDLKGASAQDTLGRLHAIDGGVPVVFTAGHGGTPPPRAADGRMETLGKPYRPAEFQSTLRRVMEGRS